MTALGIHGIDKDKIPPLSRSQIALFDTLHQSYLTTLYRQRSSSEPSRLRGLDHTKRSAQSRQRWNLHQRFRQVYQVPRRAFEPSSLCQLQSFVDYEQNDWSHVLCSVELRLLLTRFSERPQTRLTSITRSSELAY